LMKKANCKIEYIEGKTQAPLKPCHKDGKHQVASRGLVKISANCLYFSMYFISVSPFCTCLSRSGVSHLCVSLSHEKLGFGLSIWH
jgi:hypothetical protein